MNEQEDLALLKVTGSRGKDSDREYVKKLANALLQTFHKHGVARLRCVGAAAINNADKAITIATIEADKQGIKLVEGKKFTTVYFKDDQTGEDVEKTAILKEVIAFPQADKKCCKDKEITNV